MSAAICLSVIIPTWQRAESLAQTLQTILREECSFDVVVVCDGEDSATRELSQKCVDQRIRWVFHEENLGLPAARNTGATHASGDILLFLDDDLEITPGLLRTHAEAHDACDKLVVQGRIIERPERQQSSKTGRFLEQGWMRTLEEFAEASWAKDKLEIPADASVRAWFGTNCSIRKDVFNAAGGFDARLRASDEEMEFGHRLYMRGVRFRIEPGAIVFHRNSKDLVAYFPRCWEASGHLDVLRASQSGERNAQTRKLISMDSGPYLSRLFHRTAWHGGVAARSAAKALYHVTEATGSRLSFRLWHDIEWAQRYWEAVREEGVTRESLRTLASNPIRVLLLHSVAKPMNAAESTYYLSPSRFRRLLDALRSGGYRSVAPEAMLQQAWGPKDFLLTFDDGYDDFYTEVFPLCETYGLKPLVFLPAAHIGGTNVWDQRNGLRTRNLLTIEQVREMQRHGVRFGSHTLTHPSLPSLSDSHLRTELFDSKKMLEDLLGTEVSTIAYPCGETNRRVRAAVIEAGYQFAFSLKSGLNQWDDPFDIPRINFDENDTAALYRFKLATGQTVREAVKFQLTPLLHLLPVRVRQELRAVREKLR